MHELPRHFWLRWYQLGQPRWRSGTQGIPCCLLSASPVTPRDSTSPCWSFGRGLPLCLREGWAGLALHFPVSVHSACWAFRSVWRCRWHLGSGPLRPQFTLVRIVGDQGGPPCAARGWSCGRHSWQEPLHPGFPCQFLGRAFAKLVKEGKHDRVACQGACLSGLASGRLPVRLCGRSCWLSVAGTASGPSTSTSSEPCWGRIG